MKMPLVTIGIPTYNRADSYLKNVLESSVNQTYDNVEIIVSDNNSTDGTEELVRKYESESPGLRYIRHKKNIGPNNNFNYCLQEATGDYFLLLHDDDNIDEDFVETCVKGAEYRTDYGVIRTGVRVMDENGIVGAVHPNKSRASSAKEFVEDWMLKRNMSVYLCSALYHRETLMKIGGFNTPYNLYQDVVAELKLTHMKGRKDLSPIKASFRRHGLNRGGKESIADWAYDSLYVLEVMKDYIDDQKLLDCAKRRLCQWNYGRASRVDSIVEKYKLAYHNYKLFDYVYSPFHNYYDRRVKSRFNRVFR